MTKETAKRYFLGGPGALSLLALVVAAFAILTPVSAQVGAKAAVSQYAAKFLCGTIPSPASPTQVLAPGVYNTAVNIHNPNNFDITIQKKAVVSEIEPAQGLPGARQTHTLQPDASMEVDCTEILNLLSGANPPCPPSPGLVAFCKGYVVVEAAQVIVSPTGATKVIAAQLDVTDIMTVKEEDGIWKDYSFKLSCPTGACSPIPGYRFDVLYNLPHRPVTPLCYDDFVLPCDIYEVEEVIRTSVAQACLCSDIFNPDVLVDLRSVDFGTDSRAVDLDFEFVQAKRVTYSFWPVPQACDLTVGKVGQPGVPGAGTITYTITVTCSPGGPGSLSNVKVHDSWPPIVIFAGPTPSQGTCGPSTLNPFECDLGVLAAGASATITFSVDTGGNVTVTDTATVDPLNTISEPNEGNNSVTISDFVP